MKNIIPIYKILLIVVLIYAGSAFISLEINPLKWDIFNRFLYVVVNIVGVGIILDSKK